MHIKLKGESWKTFRKENWRQGECYQISSFGRVQSEKHIKRNRVFKLSNINGYDAFTAIREDKSNNLVYVHKAVAELFIENPDKKPFVIHKDFDKTNNLASNLGWATRKEMTDHSQNNPLVIKGKAKRKQNRPYAKLSEGKVRMIKRKLFDPNRRTRLRLIAKQFGISEMQLWRIKSGENWADITDF